MLVDLRIKYCIKARNMIKIPLLINSHVRLTDGPLCNMYQPLGAKGGNQMLQNLRLPVRRYYIRSCTTLLVVILYQLSEIQCNNYLKILFKKQVCICIYLLSSFRQGHDNMYITLICIN